MKKAGLTRKEMAEQLRREDGRKVLSVSQLSGTTIDITNPRFSHRLFFTMRLTLPQILAPRSQIV
jgi:hypothetical protein